MSETTTPIIQTTTQPESNKTSILGEIITSVYSLTILLAVMVIAYFSGDTDLFKTLAIVAATNAGTVVNYWVGSSKGSSDKTAFLTGFLKGK